MGSWRSSSGLNIREVRVNGLFGNALRGRRAAGGTVGSVNVFDYNLDGDPNHDEDVGTRVHDDGCPYPRKEEHEIL